MKFQTTTQVLFNVLANLLALPHHEKFMQELYLLMMVSNYIVGRKVYSSIKIGSICRSDTNERFLRNIYTHKSSCNIKEYPGLDLKISLYLCELCIKINQVSFTETDFV